MQASPSLTNLGAAELELFKEIQHGRGVDEDNDPYVRDNAVALSGSSLDGAMLAVAERSNSDYPNGGVAIYLRSPDDAPVPRPTPRPTSRPTFRPTSSPRDESDGARTASMAWAALLLVALLA